jgi:GGDEF domain-containing protein
MPLISIKKYLDLANSGDYRPILDLLADTVTQHPIAFNSGQSEQFRSDVAAILGQLSVPVDVEQFSTATAAISQALERHNQFVATLISNQSGELQNMVIMLTQAIRSLGSASDVSVRNLEEIAVQLKRTSTLEDVAQLRKRLSECLENLRNETARQKDEHHHNLQALHVKLAESQRRLAKHDIAADVDPVTGFAGRHTAERLIQETLDATKTAFLLVTVLKGIQAINSLFGYDIGDEMMCEFSTALAAHFPSPAAICRWSGPTIVVLLHRPGPIQVLRMELGHAVAAVPTSKVIASGGRKAMANFTTETFVIPVTSPAGGLFSQIDEFVATRVHE